MKKQLSILLVIVLVMASIIVPTEARESDIVGKIEDNYNETISYAQLQMQKTYEVEKEAIEIYDCLMEQLTVQSLEMDQEDYIIIYPENYGGAYLDGNGELVVCMTEGMEEDIPYSISGYEEGYTTKLVDYSLNELKEAHRRLLDYLFGYEDMYETSSLEYELFSSIIGMGTDQMNNFVYVQMQDVTDEKVQCFNAVFGEDSDIYYISEVGGTEPTATLRPGGKLLLQSTGSGYGSIGFRASFTDDDANTFNGFVTAGHCFKTEGASAYVPTIGSSRANVGRALVTMMSGSVDGCFVGITNSSYTMGNVAAYSNDTGSDVDAPVISSTYYSGANSLLSNSTIYKVGATTFFTAGHYVTDDHVSTYGGDVRLTNMLTHTALTQPGDSGGCVFTYRNNKNIVIGVTSGNIFRDGGQANNPSDFLEGICSQARYMIPRLGITIK